MSKEAMKLALEALSPWAGEDANHTEQYAAYQALREALAEQPAQQQEPVAWEYGDEIFWHNAPDINDHIRATGRPLVYADTSPPASKPWVGLTEDNIPAFPWVSQSAQRKPLTDGQVIAIANMAQPGWVRKDSDLAYLQVARAIEAAHGIKENT